MQQSNWARAGALVSAKMAFRYHWQSSPCVLAGLRLESNITVATPKVSLLGGWLDLPRWASHPLDFTLLPGRSKIASLTLI